MNPELARQHAEHKAVEARIARREPVCRAIPAAVKREETAVVEEQSLEEPFFSFPQLRGRVGPPSCRSFAPTVLMIQRATARNYGVNLTDILSARRTANVVRPRQVAMYLSKMLTVRSLPDIGRRFGRDHTTVLHAVRKIERWRHEQPKIDDAITAIERALRGDA